MTHKISLDNLTKFFITVMGIVVVSYVLKELQNVFLPFVIAYLLYFIFLPLNNYLTSRKVPLGVAGLIDIAIMFLIFYVLGKFIVDGLVSFGSELGKYEADLSKMIAKGALALGINDPAFQNFSFAELLKSIDYGSLAGGVINSTIDLVGHLLLVIFFFMFILPGHKAIYHAIEIRVVSPKKQEVIRRKQSRQQLQAEIEEEERELEEQAAKLEKTFKSIPEQIQKYILTKVLVNSAAGVTVGLLLWILGVPFPIVWGTFVAILNFIPTIGSAFALILPALMALIASGNVGFMVAVIVAVALTQTFYFNYLEPMIVGKRLNLNPLVILISVMVWGYIWGVTGMFLAVPLTAILKIVISNFDSKNLQFVSNLMGSME